MIMIEKTVKIIIINEDSTTIENKSNSYLRIEILAKSMFNLVVLLI